MKIKLRSLLSLALLFTIFTIGVVGIETVNAIDITSRLSDVGGNAGYQDDAPNLPKTIGRIVQGLLSLLGIIFMGYIIYAGQLWMTARGNEEQITKAKAIIRGSVVGLLIVMMAYAITAFVIRTTIESTGYTSTSGGSANSKPSSGSTNTNTGTGTNTNTGT